MKNLIIKKDLGHTVTYECDGYREGFRRTFKQRRFRCIGGPLEGAHRTEIEHQNEDLIGRFSKPGFGYRPFNNAGLSKHSQVWVWIDE